MELWKRSSAEIDEDSATDHPAAEREQQSDPNQTLARKRLVYPAITLNPTNE